MKITLSGDLKNLRSFKNLASRLSDEKWKRDLRGLLVKTDFRFIVSILRTGRLCLSLSQTIRILMGSSIWRRRQVCDIHSKIHSPMSNLTSLAKW